MSFKIGFVIDPITSLHISMDTSLLMVAEANKRGHQVYCVTLDALELHNNKLYGHWQKFNYRGAGEDLASSVDAKEFMPMDYFDMVIMRKDPPFDQTYLAATYLLDYANTIVINDPAGLRTVNEKMYALRWPEYSPQSFVSNKIESIKTTIIEQRGAWVLKPLWECGGIGVIKVDKDTLDSEEFLTSTNGDREFVIVQRFIDQVYDGDRRVFILDGEPLAWMNRLPPENDFRANIHLGAKPVAYQPNVTESKVANVIGKELKALGLPLVCLDMIGGYLTEVNVTSPSGIPEINKVTGEKYEVQLIDYIERRIALRSCQ